MQKKPPSGIQLAEVRSLQWSGVFLSICTIVILGIVGSYLCSAHLAPCMPTRCFSFNFRSPKIILSILLRYKASNSTCFLSLGGYICWKSHTGASSYLQQRSRKRFLSLRLSGATEYAAIACLIAGSILRRLTSADMFEYSLRQLVSGTIGLFGLPQHLEYAVQQYHVQQTTRQ